MPRGPRYIPPGWSVEVTTSTICNFFLLPTTRQFARTFVGVLGRAQEMYPVRVHAAVAVSSHYHLIVTPDDAEQLANFMEQVNGNLAREAGRIIGWRGRFWRERYHAIPISPEPEEFNVLAFDVSIHRRVDGQWRPKAKKNQVGAQHVSIHRRVDGQLRGCAECSPNGLPNCLSQSPEGATANCDVTQTELAFIAAAKLSQSTEGSTANCDQAASGDGGK